MTANAMRGEDLVCRRAGMEGDLAKPVRTDLLARTLDAATSGGGES